MSYDALDDGEMVGLEDVVDTASPGLEDGSSFRASSSFNQSILSRSDLG